jgi:hypothetical protein
MLSDLLMNISLFLEMSEKDKTLCAGSPSAANSESVRGRWV